MNGMKKDGGKPASRSRASWLWTAITAAFVAMVVPSMTFAQTTDVLTEGVSAQASSPAKVSGSADASVQVPSGISASNDFYLLAGVALDWSETTRFTDKDCSSTSPAALYGCGTGVDGAPRSSLGDFGTMAVFEPGVGYIVAPFLRLEAAVQYRPNFSFEGRANFTQTTGRQAVSADMSSLSGMLAAYLDLPGLDLPRPGPFSPFIGGGMGLSRIDIDETRMEFPKTTTFVPGDCRVNLAWMLTAGVATALGKNVTLDLAWRYMDSGAVETGNAKGRIVWRDGSRDPLEIDLAKTRATLSSHELRLSLCYAF